MRRLAFIRPSIGQLAEGWPLDSGCMEPLTFAVLAALCPPNWEIVLYDQRIEIVPIDCDVNAACFSIETYNVINAYKLMDLYRQAGVIVIAGGMHASLAPQEVALHADCIVIGDAECIWPNLIRDLERGSLMPMYRGSLLNPQSGLLPRRAIYAEKKRRYLPVSLLQYGRGCKYNCTYCSSAAYFKGGYSHRPVGEVIREIKEQGLRRIIFTDDNIVADRQAALELFKGIKPLGIKWGGQASLDLADDPELLEMMMESGCLGNIFGFESINESSLKTMAKAQNLKDFDGYSRRIAQLRKQGCFLWGSFSIGHDGDDASTLEDTLNFVLHHKFTIASFMMLTPMPGTPLYARLAGENRLLYNGRWWLDSEYRYNKIPFIPKNMGVEEINSKFLEILRRCYSTGSIAKRFYDPHTHGKSPSRALYYMAINFLYRSTSVKKA